MADYVSSLTGSAMDAALLDMAEHNSEAWAVGERNGIAVDSSDVAYHNNARYYAQQAQSIAPASVTEAVRWDVAQTALTDAQRLQGRENIKATSHNYNLLDNGWFLVNSRGATSGSAAGYFLDRWKISLGNGGSVSWSVSGGVLTINGTATFLEQKPMADVSWMVGQTLTLSVMLSSGSVEQGSITRSASTQTFFTSTGYYAYMGANGYVGLSISGNVSIKAIKLELGSFSTLANDTPPDYGEELTRCIYSTADPSDTYANNGFGRTNPNLLDNPFFGSGEVVNQRGVTSGTTTNATYFIDRWLTTYGSAAGTYSVGSGGITLTPASSTTVTMYQKFANATYQNGKTLTASVLLSDGTIYSGTITRANGTVQNYYYDNGVRIRQVADNAFHIDISAAKTIRAVKLELGTVSTLANDVPPDYGTELLKCMRYFQRITAPAYGCGYAIGRAYSAYDCRVFLPLPVPLRTSPTVSTANLGSVQLGGNGSSYSVTSASYSGRSENGVCLSFAASGLTANQLYMLWRTGNDNVYIDLSADL